jgi:hypothetical protein
VEIEELISNGSTASMTAASACVQDPEAELAAKTEQIENLEGQQVNMSGDGRSESSMGDADAVARAETRTGRNSRTTQTANATPRGKLSDRRSLCQVSHDAHFF